MPRSRRAQLRRRAQERVLADVRSTVRPGDVIATARSDVVSRLIRFGTCSAYSHVGVFAGSGVVFEAYPSLRGGRRNGLRETGLDHFLLRGRLTGMRVVRFPGATGDPKELRRRFEALADITGTFGLLHSLPIVVLGVASPTRRLRLGQLTDWIIRRNRPMHCAHFATELLRIDSAARPSDAAWRFPHLRLRSSSFVMPGDLANDGTPILQWFDRPCPSIPLRDTNGGLGVAAHRKRFRDHRFE